MEQASACHCGTWAATLATLVGLSHSIAKRGKQKPKTTGHYGKEKRKPQRDNFEPQENHDQTTLEGKTIPTHFGGLRNPNMRALDLLGDHDWWSILEGIGAVVFFSVFFRSPQLFAPHPFTGRAADSPEGEFLGATIVPQGVRSTLERLTILLSKKFVVDGDLFYNVTVPRSFLPIGVQ